MPANFRFGSSPPRSIETFGVAGVLDSTAQIYSETLFNTTHIGRVSDLVTAQLRSLGVSELRLRALMLFATFEGYETQRGGRTNEGGGIYSLEEPLVIECGSDNEKVVVGLSFTYPSEMSDSIDGVVDRVKSGEISSAFESMLSELYRNSDSVLVRVQQNIRRLELIAFLARPGKVAEDAISSDLVMIRMDQKIDKEPPSAIYSELADLDYTRLLADEGKGRLPDAPSSGELLQKSFAELEEALRVRAQALKPAEDSVTVVRGGPQPGGDGGRLVIPGSSAASPDQENLIAGLQERIRELESRIASTPIVVAAPIEPVAPASYAPSPVEPTVPVEPVAAPEAEKPSDSEETSEDDETVAELAGKTLRGLFGKVKGLTSKARDETVQVVKGASEPVQDEAVVVVKGSAPEPVDEQIKVFKADPVEAEEVIKVSGDSEVPDVPESTVSEDDVSGNFLVELQEGSLERMISRAQKESDEVRKEISSTRAKRWVDGLMTELMEEKARLQEFAKKVNHTVKQREYEFKKRETAYDEAIKKRDSVLRQKNAALMRAKDQVTHLSQTVDRLKAGPGAGREDSHSKQKLEMANRLVSVHKEQNAQLQKRVEDLSEKLAGLQSGLKSRGSGEVMELREKCDRLNRQVEELKRVNQGLMEKVGEPLARTAKPAASGAPMTVEEMRRKLEAAVKVAAQHQKDAEMKQLRVEELDREAIRLQKELDSALKQLKALQGKAA